MFHNDPPPSYRNGFARGPGESQHPEYWRGLFICFAPILRPGGIEQRELVGRGWFTQRNATQVCNTAITEDGPCIVPTVSARSWLEGTSCQANTPVGRCTAIYGGNPCGSNNKYDAGLLHDETFIKGVSGYPKWKVRVDGSQQNCVASSTSYGTYQDYGFVYDGTGFQSWVDGAKVGSPVADGGDLDNSGLNEVTIFNRNSKSDYQAAAVSAYCHYLYVWNRALTDREMVGVASDPLCFLRWRWIVVADRQTRQRDLPEGTVGG